MVGESTLYHELTRIAEDYLGPAAPRFMSRIIESHFHKSPNEITAADIPQLITWVQLSVSLMTDKQDDVTQFVGRLNQLADRTPA